MSMKQKVVIHDKMQSGYIYFLTQPIGMNFDPDFRPQLTPKEMLNMGVFGGRYIRDCQQEFPVDWYTHAKLFPLNRPGHDIALNYYQVEASQSLHIWQVKNWVYSDDPRGWFQWYCRYFMGRRHERDAAQIKRWKAMRRHVAQIKNNCMPFDETCRRKQRQALLHWAYDSRRM